MNNTIKEMSRYIDSFEGINKAYEEVLSSLDSEFPEICGITDTCIKFEGVTILNDVVTESGNLSMKAHFKVSVQGTVK